MQVYDDYEPKENEMRPNRSPKTLAIIAVIGAVAVVSAFVVAYGWGRDFGREVAVPTTYEHLQHFQDLADEHGDRAAGTSGYEAAAQYVEDQLERAGYDSTRQYFTFENHGEQIETFNILAETDTGSEENVVVLGAHLDGVPGSPAINDNASGTAALLTSATTLRQHGESVNKVRFVWWGAEEYPTSHGSHHYVDELAENSNEALQAISAYLNFDMVASPNPIIGIYGTIPTDDDEADAAGPAEDSHHTDSALDVPEGSDQVTEFFADYFDSRDQPWITTGWNIDSDHVAFVKEGVAVGGLFTGSSEKKTDRQARVFGGTAGEPRDPNYHQPGDDLSNVDQKTLDIMTEAITHAAVRLAQDSSAFE